MIETKFERLSYDASKGYLNVPSWNAGINYLAGNFGQGIRSFLE